MLEESAKLLGESAKRQEEGAKRQEQGANKVAEVTTPPAYLEWRQQLRA